MGSTQLIQQKPKRYESKRKTRKNLNLDLDFLMSNNPEYINPLFLGESRIASPVPLSSSPGRLIRIVIWTDDSGFILWFECPKSDGKDDDEWI